MTDDNVLASRVRALEDRFALQDLVHRYGVKIDERDLAAVGEMFADEALFIHPGGTAVGGAAIVAAYAGRLQMYTTTYHYAHTQGIEFTGPNSANGLVTGHAELSIEGRSHLVALRYYDKYVRISRGWVFLERKQQFTYVLPFDELATGLGDNDRKRWPGTEPTSVEVPDGFETFRSFLEQNQ